MIKPNMNITYCYKLHVDSEGLKRGKVDIIYEIVGEKSQYICSSTYLILILYDRYIY